jgi:hypothetical protein
MHSNYSSNTPCSKFGKVVNVADANEELLPVIDRDDFLAGHDDLLEDFDSILDEIAISNSISSSPSAMTDDTKKPSACRNLGTVTTKDDQKKNIEKGDTSRLRLRERSESFLDVEFLSREEDRGDAEEPSTKENAENIVPEKQPKRGLRSKRFKKKTRRCQKIEKCCFSPVVWVIEPGYNNNGTLRFKFTTDAGACLILKDEEALASIDIMRASSRNNTYFQVYSIEGNSSRVVKPAQIVPTMASIIAESKPKPEEEDALTIEAVPTSRKRTGHRFYRFLLRRRWKRLVRHQVRIAVGDSRGRTRFASLTNPFIRIWKRFPRRDRAAV